MSKIEFWLRLLMIKGLNAKKLERFTTGFHQRAEWSLADIQALPLSDRERGAFFTPPQELLHRSLIWAEQQNNRMVFLGEADYPPSALSHLSPACRPVCSRKQSGASAAAGCDGG
jgi:predicted Rossmann fold nucleotide-binding protein DprA/Smf involved in DNA uptake